MAEGWARKLLPMGVHVWSAGSEPTTAVNPYAIKVMKEAGIDISGHRPKRIGDIPWGDVDMVITMCAEEVCPLPPEGMQQENWALPDPSAAAGSPTEIEDVFRKTRDQIRAQMDTLLERYHT
jgi:arsenate reductase